VSGRAKPAEFVERSRRSALALALALRRFCVGLRKADGIAPICELPLATLVCVQRDSYRNGVPRMSYPPRDRDLEVVGKLNAVHPWASQCL
jgi:hypothetical protein